MGVPKKTTMAASSVTDAEAPKRAPSSEESRLLGDKGREPAIPKVLMTLHVPRLFGCVHIILMHFGPPLLDRGGVVRGGYVWLQFFFMLSAFGAAHSQMSSAGLRATAESGVWHPDERRLLRRAISVYPTYLVALLLCCFLRCLSMSADGSSADGISADGNSTESCILPKTLILEGLMLQGWFPWGAVTDPTAYNGPDWFVSALTGCWLFESAAIRLGSMACVRAGPGNIPWTGLACVVFYMLVSPVVGYLYTWAYLAEGEVSALSHLHVYFCGTLLACWLHSRADAKLSPLPWLATASTLVLLCLVCVDISWLVTLSWFGADDAQVHSNFKHFNESGVFVLIFGALITGLVGGTDPIARALNRLPDVVNNAARDLAMGMYLLQKPAALAVCLLWNQGRSHLWIDGWPEVTSSWAELGIFFLVTLAGAVAVQYALQKPIARYVQTQLSQRPP